MKFLERFALVVYSYIVLLLAVVVSLLIFNWLDLDTLTEMTETLITGDISSKVLLGVNALLILLSLKCIFFDESSKEKMREAQGILLKNENGELMITKDTLDNMVKKAVVGFEEVKDCKAKISINQNNEISITLYIAINENVVIKDLAINLQTKVKEEVKNSADLDVKTVNVKIVNLQDDQNN